MKQIVRKISFASGIIRPELAHRSDLAQVSGGASDLKNVVVQPGGWVRSRYKYVRGTAQLTSGSKATYIITGEFPAGATKKVLDGIYATISQYCSQINAGSQPLGAVIKVLRGSGELVVDDPAATTKTYHAAQGIIAIHENGAMLYIPELDKWYRFECYLASTEGYAETSAGATYNSLVDMAKGFAQTLIDNAAGLTAAVPWNLSAAEALTITNAAQGIISMNSTNQTSVSNACTAYINAMGALTSRVQATVTNLGDPNVGAAYFMTKYLLVKAQEVMQAFPQISMNTDYPLMLTGATWALYGGRMVLVRTTKGMLEIRGSSIIGSSRFHDVFASPLTEKKVSEWHNFDAASSTEKTDPILLQIPIGSNVRIHWAVGIKDKFLIGTSSGIIALACPEYTLSATASVIPTVVIIPSPCQPIIRNDKLLFITDSGRLIEYEYDANADAWNVRGLNDHFRDFNNPVQIAYIPEEDVVAVIDGVELFYCTDHQASGTLAWARQTLDCQPQRIIPAHEMGTEPTSIIGYYSGNMWEYVLNKAAWSEQTESITSLPLVPSGYVQARIVSAKVITGDTAGLTVSAMSYDGIDSESTPGNIIGEKILADQEGRMIGPGYTEVGIRSRTGQAAIQIVRTTTGTKAVRVSGIETKVEVNEE